MKLELDIQNPNKIQNVPSKADFTTWVKATLGNEIAEAEMTIRIVDETESRHLNYNYRKKNKATNVMSFPVDAMNENEDDILVLGDLVICAAIVAKEAEEDDKDEIAHWAHLTIHGTLHLLGYDHEREADAKEMEKLETEIMLKLGFKDPYS